MKNRCFVAFLTVVCTFSLLSGCALVQVVADNFQKPKVSFRDVEVRSLNLQGLTLDFRFDVENQNGVGVRVASLDYDLSLQGVRVAKGSTDRALEVPSRGHGVLALPYEVRFSELPATLGAFTSLSSTVSYRVQVVVGIDTPMGVVHVSREFTGNIDLPRPTTGVLGL